MHRALNIEDIVVEVVKQVHYADLPRLARVCRSFHTPCIKKIYRRMVKLRPLMNLLPGNIARPFNHPPPVLKGFPQEDDWDRYRLHAPLITRLDLCIGLPFGMADPYDNRTSSADLETLQTLILFRPSDPLFPSLRSLGLIILSDEALYWSSALFTVSVETLELQLGENVTLDCVSTSLGVLFRRVHLLANLTLDIDGEVPASQGGESPIIKALECLRRLRKARLWFILPGILPALATFYNLDELELSLFGTSDLQSISTEESCDFHHLKTWAMSGSPEDCGALLDRHLILPAEINLSLDLYDSEIPQALPALTLLIVHNFPYLRDLKIAWDSRDVDGPMPVKPSNFKPLFRCTLLQRLSIHVFSQNIAYAPLWEDADILDLTQSLPHLKQLELRLDCQESWTPLISLSGLIHLARYCPRLSGLWIAVDASSFKSTSSVCEPAPALEWWVLETHSIFHCAEREAAVIAAIWPNMRMKALGSDTILAAACERFNTLGRQGRTH